MLTDINYNLPPNDFFFVPGVDAGLALLQPTEWIWRTAQHGHISGFAVSNYESHNDSIETVVEQSLNSRRLRSAIEFNAIPAVATNLSIVHNCVAINGKWLLSGAAGSRIRNRSVWRSAADPIEVDGQTDAYLSSFQGADSKMKPLPVTDDDVSQLPYVIEARNLFNYYHFVCETLPRLQVPIDINHKGPIYICYKGDAVSGFPQRLIDALFPEIADRVEFVQTPKSFARAVIDFSWDHYFNVAPDHIVPSITPLIPDSQKWLQNSTARTAGRALERNMFNTLLVRLRERALNAVADMDTSHLPKKFWVTRDSASPRARMMKNEDALIKELTKLGFETVLFENYSALEQIAMMANADIMASHHGAGFANMLFAGPDTQVIEIGTPQTALVRWPDFFPLAHAAGAKYTTFFADMDWSTPEAMPNFDTDGHIPVAISANSIKTVIGFIAALTGDLPRKIGRKRLMQITQLLDQAKQFRIAADLLEKYDNIVQGDVDLMRLYVKVCTELDLPDETFEMLKAIWILDQSKAATLERMIWLSRRTGELELAPALVAEHRQRFPHRHADFRKKIRWFDRLEQA